MSIYLSEDEQMQKIKEWVKKNGIMVVLGIAVFFAANVGWRYWQKHQNYRSIQASSLYEQMLMAHVTHRYDDVKLYAERLRDDYTKTPYASLASLMTARDATVKKDLLAAEQNLQWVVKHAKSKVFKQIARLRLARVLNEAKQQTKALAVLTPIDDEAYLAKIHETRGDIYLAAGDKNSALREYQMSAESIGDGDNGVGKAFIEMKLNQLL